MGMLERINARARGAEVEKAFTEPTFWAQDAIRWPLMSVVSSDREQIENDFEGYVQGAYKSDGIIFACIDRRQQVFSQARFRFRTFVNGEPQQLFGGTELKLLERPWQNGTTGELLALMEYDASLAGNFYATICDDAGRLGKAARGEGRRIVRMRPDWTTLVIDAPSGNPFALDARVVGYSYQPRNVGGARQPEPVVLLPDEVAHYSPKPDPTARFRGMSWITPVIRDLMADKAATLHKLKFFENGATPQFVVRFDKDSSDDEVAAFVSRYQASHKGSNNAYKTLFLAGGADITPLTVDLKQLDFKVTTGAGETRMAVAAGVPAVILGISEGLQGSSLNAGNFGAARRLFVDTTMRDAWAKAAASLQTLITPPNGAELWYSERDIPFLREDASDIAAIQQMQSTILQQLVATGYEPDASVDFLRTNDLAKLLGSHTGLVSVQLQPPGVMGESPVETGIPEDGQ